MTIRNGSGKHEKDKRKQTDDDVNDVFRQCAGGGHHPLKYRQMVEDILAEEP